MTFERNAERKIREAMQAGEFDNLPGRGKPIDLEEYFQTPEDLRLAYSVLKSANCRPEEVELLNELAAIDRRIGAASRDERPALEREKRDLRLRLDILLEERKRKRS